MTASVRLAVAIPQTSVAGAPRPESIREYLRRAEALGFESAWVVEQILGRIASLEPVALLTWAAAVTDRIRLGSAVLLPALRSPVHLAKSLVTLDHLSRGRLIVGLGLGGQRGVYPAFGLQPEDRAERFVEGIRLMQRLWTEPRVTFAGRFWRLQDVAMEPKPLQQPYPPIWFGAHHPSALARAVAVGQGFVGAGSASTATFAAEARTVRKLLAEAGRDPNGFTVAKRVYVAIDADRERAGRRLAEWFGAFYGKPDLAAEVAVWGPPDACIAGLRQVVAAGAEVVMFHPVFDELAQLERFAADVAPAL
jgi:probable F420-dependent oxidoreductase